MPDRKVLNRREDTMEYTYEKLARARKRRYDKFNHYTQNSFAAYARARFPIYCS